MHAVLSVGESGDHKSGQLTRKHHRGRSGSGWRVMKRQSSVSRKILITYRNFIIHRLSSQNISAQVVFGKHEKSDCN